MERIPHRGAIFLNDSRCLRASRVAEILSISVHTLRAWRTQGKGPPWHKIGQRVVAYPESDLWAWLIAHQRHETEAGRRFNRAAWHAAYGDEVPMPHEAQY